MGVRSRIIAGEGLSDAPGTPFGIDPAWASLVLLGEGPEDPDRVPRVGGPTATVVVDLGDSADGEALRALQWELGRLGIDRAWFGVLPGGASHLGAVLEAFARTSAHRVVGIVGSASEVEPRPLPRRSLELAPCLRVRPLEVSEWEALWALYEAVLDTTEGPHPTDLSGWTRGEWPLPELTRAALDAGEVRGCYLDGSLVGAMMLTHDIGAGAEPDDWEPLGAGQFLALHQLTVAPSARGRGVAVGLVAAAAAEVAETGGVALRLTTAANNTPANRLYRELGFTMGRPVPFDYGSIPIAPWGTPYELRV